MRGMRVALLEARAQKELASLVERHGGEPYCVPAVREAFAVNEAEVQAVTEAIERAPHSVVIFSTGVGASALLAVGGERLRRALAGTVNVCRGPKPVAVLKRLQIPIAVRAAPPHTTAELIASLDGIDLRGALVVVIHHGEKNPILTQIIAARGAVLRELVLYAWRLPEDVGPLDRLVDEIIERRVGAVAFTSQVQVRHLCQVAGKKRLPWLIDAMRSRVLVAAVGPTCAAALDAIGVPPHVVPANPSMGAMIAALASYMREEARA